MKPLLVLLLSLALATTSLSQKKCYLNKHLEIRSKMQTPLVAYSHVQKISENGLNYFAGKCGGEWDKHGVCCNPWTIQHHIDMMESYIIRASDGLVKFYAGMNQVVPRLFAELKKLALSAPIEHRNDVIPSIEFAKKFLNDGANLLKFEQFKYVGADSIAYKNEMEKCWNDMKSLRIASLCSICSGRNEIYFHKDKAVLLDEVCQRSLNNCLESFNMTIRLLNLLKWFREINKSFMDIGIQIGVQAWINYDKIDRAYEELKKEDMLEKIKKFNPQSIDSRLAISICEQYFDLAKLPFISILNDGFFDNSVSIVLDDRAKQPISWSTVKIESSMQQYEEQLDKILQTYKQKLNDPQVKISRSRLLQLCPSSDKSIFVSDTEFFPKSDNIFSSIVDVKEANLTPDVVHPMNMTLSVL